MSQVTSRPWTEADLKRLRELAGIETAKEIARQLGRTRFAVLLKTSALGLQSVKSGWQHPWTIAQLQMLRDEHAKGTAPTTIARMCGKSKSALYKKSREIGLVFSGQHVWSEEDRQLIRDSAGVLTALELARRIGVSEGSVRYQALMAGVVLKPGSKSWKRETVDMLRELSGSLTLAELATRLGRTERAVEVRARKLGLQVKRERSAGRAPRESADAPKMERESRPARKAVVKTEPTTQPVEYVSRLAWCAVCSAPVVNTIEGWAAHNERVGCNRKVRVA